MVCLSRSTRLDVYRTALDLEVIPHLECTTGNLLDAGDGDRCLPRS